MKNSTSSVPVKRSFSSNRKRLAGVAFALTFGLFLMIAHLFFAGYGNYVTPSQFHTMLVVDTLLFCFGTFSLIKSKLIALIVTLSILLTLVVIFVLWLFFAVFFNDLFPTAINSQRLKILEDDGILNCPVASSTFQQAEHSHLTEFAGHPNSFDGGETPTTVSRGLSLNAADHKGVLTTFANCAHANGWVMTPDSTGAFGNPEQRGTKNFPGGWSARLYVEINEHLTDYQGNPSGQPNIQLLIETDFVR